MSKRNTSKEWKTNIQQPTNSWVFLLKDEMLKVITSDNDKSNNTPDIIRLRHPRTKEDAVFLISADNSSIQEILTFSETRSWFIDETVKSDGSIRISTAMDPIFLVLPYIRKDCIDKAIPLEQLLQDMKYPETFRLMKCKGLDYLHLVADKKGCNDIIAYKYNEEKTLSWLKKKTERLADIVRTKNIVSETDKFAHLRYASGIISDYLEEDLHKKLAEYLNLPEESPQKPLLKRKSVLQVEEEEEENTHNVKKSKSNEKTKTPKTKKNSTPTLKNKSKSKSTTGMKSIANYFQVSSK